MSLILSTINICFPVSGCVGRGPSALLFPGAYNVVKTALGGSGGCHDIIQKA